MLAEKSNQNSYVSYASQLKFALSVCVLCLGLVGCSGIKLTEQADASREAIFKKLVGSDALKDPSVSDPGLVLDAVGEFAKKLEEYELANIQISLFTWRKIYRNL